MSGRKEKIQYKAGKLLFEEKLKSKLKQASEYNTMGKMEMFARATRTVWIDCFNKDQEKILDTVEEWSDSGQFQSLRGVWEFKKYVKIQPTSYKSHMFKGTKRSKKWEDIYRVIQEALRRRYSGGTTTIKEDEISDSLPDSLEFDENKNKEIKDL